MLYYNKIRAEAAALAGQTAMALHDRSERVSVSPSILRLSVWQRLAAVSVLIVLIWAAVYGTIG
jgi:hypothetical protein